MAIGLFISTQFLIEETYPLGGGKYNVLQQVHYNDPVTADTAVRQVSYLTLFHIIILLHSVFKGFTANICVNTLCL